MERNGRGNGDQGNVVKMHYAKKYAYFLFEFALKKSPGTH